MSFSTSWLQVGSASSGVPLLGLRSSSSLSSSSGAESGPSLAALGLYSAVFTSSSGALRSIQSPDTNAVLGFRAGSGSSDPLLLLSATNESSPSRGDATRRSLDRAHDAILTICGRKQLYEAQRVPRLRALVKRACGLLSVLTSPPAPLYASVHLGLSEMVIPDIVSPSQIESCRILLRSVVDACNSTRVALLHHNKLLTCTQDWFELDRRDQFSLILLLRSSPPSKLRETPVYLKHSDPTTSKKKATMLHRLVYVRVSYTMGLLLLCDGLRPSGLEIEHSIASLYHTSISSIEGFASNLHALSKQESERPFNLVEPELAIDGVLFVYENRYFWAWVDVVPRASEKKRLRSLFEAETLLTHRVGSHRHMDSGAIARPDRINLHFKVVVMLMPTIFQL